MVSSVNCLQKVAHDMHVAACCGGYLHLLCNEQIFCFVHVMDFPNHWTSDCQSLVINQFWFDNRDARMTSSSYTFASCLL